MMRTNSNTAENRTTLVIGASGKTGRRVTERLRAAGRPVRAPRDFADYLRDTAASGVYRLEGKVS